MNNFENQLIPQDHVFYSSNNKIGQDYSSKSSNFSNPFDQKTFNSRNFEIITDEYFYSKTDKNNDSQMQNFNTNDIACALNIQDSEIEKKTQNESDTNLKILENSSLHSSPNKFKLTNYDIMNSFDINKMYKQQKNEIMSSNTKKLDEIQFLTLGGSKGSDEKQHEIHNFDDNLAASFGVENQIKAAIRSSKSKDEFKEL